MESSNSSPTPAHRTPEELLSHTRWLRALARQMVRDEATADDLVQDTWVAALRRPPSGRSQGEGLRAWLSRVLLNAARQRARSGQRRDDREEMAAREEAVPPSAEDLIERIELQKKLLSEVGKLAEPYRTVVLLRYDEDLSAMEIARRLDKSPATIRTQLKRGLDRLRERMDETSGGRAAWATLLAPSALLEGALMGTAAHTAAREVISMSVSTKMGIAAAATVVALAGVFGLRSDPEDEGTTAVVSEAEDTSAGSVEPLAHAEEVASPERVAARALVPERAPTANVSAHVIEALIVDGRGRPVRGATLARPGRAATSPPSDAKGLARLSLGVEAGGLALGERGAVRIEAAGYQPLEIQIAREAGPRTWLGEISLLGGARIRGRVLDEAGLPVAGGQVLLIKGSAISELERAKRSGPGFGDTWDRKETATDAEGRFLFEAFETGSRTVWARGKETLWAIEGPLDVQPGEELELTLRPARPELGMRITGVVLDPLDRVVPDAAIKYYDDPGRGIRMDSSDEHGRFNILLEFSGPHQLRAVHPEGHYPEVLLEAVAPGSQGLVLRFQETRLLRIVGRGPQGEVPIRSAHALADDEDVIVSSAKNTLEDGSRTLREPNEPFHLVVRAEGFAERKLGPLSPGKLDDPTYVDLDPTGALRGRVVHGGTPVAGASIEVFEMARPRTRISHGGLPVRRSPHAKTRAATDEDGAFLLTPRELERFHLRVEAEGFAPTELLIENYDARRGEDVLLEVGQGGSLRGVVLPAADRSASGLYVIAHRGDARERVTRLGPDGIFSFERLLPGRWMVETASEYEETPASMYTGSREPFDALPWNVEVRAGEQSHLELDLEKQPLAAVVGTLYVDGEPAREWIASLMPRDGRTIARPSSRPHAELDDFGGFRLETSQLGESYLSLTNTSNSALVLQAPLNLVEGEQAWELEIELGAVTLSGLGSDFDATTRPMLVWKQGDVQCVLNVTTAPQGRAHFARVPAGSLRLSQYRRQGLGLREVVLATGTLRAGQTLTLNAAE